MKNNIKIIWKNYSRKLYECIEDEFFQLALERAIDSYRKRFREVIEKYPEIIKLAEEVKKIKEYSIEHNRELVKEAIDMFEENGSIVHLASNAKEANEIITEIIGDGELVVKSKSMVTEEIGLREYLEKLGIKVWETDLGEFIIQLANSKPMHIVTPSIHIPREKVAELFSKLMGEEVDKNDIEGMVAMARRFLRDKYFRADIGITGANVIAAKEGAALIIENEGNAKLTMSIPKKHIIVTGIEKIVPDLNSAIKVALVTLRYASYKITSYINIVFGPSHSYLLNKTFNGLNGPEEVHVVFLDNGRSEMMQDNNFKQATYCLRCGRCIYECTAFRLFAGYFGGRTYMSGIGTVWSAFTEGLEQAIPAAYTCLLDGRCRVSCPLGIDIPSMVLSLRNKITSYLGYH